jgi:uncharacterized heparinase superfamily protein
MTSQWLKNLSHKAAQVKILHPLYNASLGKLDSALTFESFPHDLLGGDAGRGRWLANGYLDINGHRVTLDSDQWFIGTNTQNTPFFDKLHGFDFLSELKSLGGDAGRKTARIITTAWLEKFQNFNRIAWDIPYTSTRLVNWMVAYPFAFETAEDDFIDNFQVSFFKQYCHLKHSLSNPQLMDVFDRFSALWSMIIVQCHCSNFYDDLELSSHLQLLKGTMNDLTLPDHGLIDRNPQNLLEMVKSLTLLRHSLQQKRIDIPLWLSQKTEQLVRLMNVMTHQDRDFPSFHGASLPNRQDIEKITKLSALRLRRVDTCLPDYGYTAMRKGRTSVIIDHGITCAPLSFEVGYGDHRMIVSCGTVQNGDDGWADSLSSQPAHSGFMIDDVNLKSGLSRGKASVESLNGAGLFIGSHDGYKPSHGLTHTRRIYIDPKGEDVRGEDLCVRNIAIKPLNFTIRFHLHPMVQASIMGDQSKIILRLPNGSGWIFYASHGGVSLQDSIYCADGFTIRKTQQICVNGTMDDLTTQIKWAIKKQ